MNILYENDYEAMSIRGAKMLIETIKQKPNAVICFATGSSPQRMYELFVEEVNAKSYDLSKLTFVKLDEWYGVEPDDSITCTTFLKKYLLEPLYMPPKNFIECRSNASDITNELRYMDDFLKEHPIDVMILGLGMNGHLGLNEPNDHLTLPCHFTPLDPMTKTHNMVKGHSVEGGLTIGMQGIFEAASVLMLVSGNRKEEAYQSFMSRQITTQTPASLLWLHKNCTTIIDKQSFMEK